MYNLGTSSDLTVPTILQQFTTLQLYNSFIEPLVPIYIPTLTDM